MTIHRLHAGDGYLYLTRQVASGDRVRDRTRDLTHYYTETGTPPGIWMGSGAEQLGLTGDVTEAQMAALFGEGLHPNADTIIAQEITAGKTARQAIGAVKLGNSFAEYTTPNTPINDLFGAAVEAFTAAEQRRPTWDERTELRFAAARTHLTSALGREPKRAEIDHALAQEKAQSRKAVAGFDCVFTPPKSISILWGLGSEKIRQEILRCHREAVREVLAWAESQCAVTRRGRNGIQEIDTHGLVIAAFEHFDNRTGDMNLHTHSVISGKTLGVDGKWSALDARPLFATGVSLSCRYNATIVGKIRRRIGFRFEPRTRRRGTVPVLEVVGIPDAMITEFSRTPDIIARTEQLITDYRATHGRNPSTTTQYKLAQQATLETRDAKPVPKALRDMLTEWADRAHDLLGDGRSGVQFIDDLLAEHTGKTAVRFQLTEVAVAVGADLGGVTGLATATRTELRARIDVHLDTCAFDNPAQRRHARTAVRTLLTRDPPADLLDRINAAHHAAECSVYEPQSISLEVADTVARRRATWTEANIRSAVEDRVGLCEFATDDQHRAAVEEVTALVRDHHSLRLTVEPDPIPTTIARANGESVFTVTGATRYTSTTVLDAETRLLDAAKTPTAHRIPAELVDRAITRIEHDEHLRLDDGQHAIAHYLCTNATLVSVAVGPAGSGKTTAMKAVAAAWLAADLDVIPLAPSASAARQLGDALGIRAKTIAALRTRAEHGLPTGLSPGAMILIDEAAMAATADLDAILALAREHDAIVRCIGDPEQLSAVEAGGIIRTLARDTNAPHLHNLVRFSDPDEADATLALRAGNLEQAWDFYNTHDRITHGMSHQLRHHILTAHLDDTAHGISSIMIAATLDNVHALNTEAQAAHAATGRIDTTGPSIRLSDNHNGYLGDTILTRLNHRGIRVTGGIRDGTGIDNGDLWRIHHIHPDGSLTATGIDHRGTVHLPADYLTRHVELGYATTIHRAQGSTVDHAYVLMDNIVGRALAYVGLTRGRHLNRIYLATDQLLDITGDQQPDDPHTPITMFAKALARQDDNLSATDTMRAEQTAADRRIRTTYTEVYQQLADARGTYLLDHALPGIFFHEATHSEHFQTLLDTIALADAHGLDTHELTTAIATDNHQDHGESLTNTDDTAAVLHTRADRWIHDNLPPTPPTATVCPVPPPHPGQDTELAAYAEQLRRHLLEPTAEQLPPPGGTPTRPYDSAPTTPPRTATTSPKSRTPQPTHRRKTKPVPGQRPRRHTL
ncbi:MobF family relaxase [Nocardia macrotermitis]|uniref:ATP-dependent RecD-like DNA helicase n=1 Tax=Nocardia macrotermitis TaxID=2585198 RepID=A0A7K0DFI6_9NOCA|nr:MobF family relaxase [Nocardia macrotermitis]MQY24419.1 ATP-dependent RecD-like DNA helicase [Nocardia macrotermitis]